MKETDQAIGDFITQLTLQGETSTGQDLGLVCNEDGCGQSRSSALPCKSSANPIVNRYKFIEVIQLCDHCFISSAIVFDTLISIQATKNYLFLQHKCSSAKRRKLSNISSKKPNQQFDLTQQATKYIIFQTQLFIQSLFIEFIQFRKAMDSSAMHKQHLQKLYNQNTVVEDSEQTSFCYLKTLALEFLIVIFTLACLLAVLMNQFCPDIISSDKLYLITALFTVLTMITVVLERLALIDWVKEKKDEENNKPFHEIISMVIELIIVAPCPNPFITGQMNYQTVDMYENPITFYVVDLLSAYLLLRCVYFLKFLIHFQLYYGSRPDRLSRLYTVRFGTFNAFKFLINEKPHVILLVIFILNYLFLPVLLLIIQGKINSKLNTFVSCLYYQVVTQVTVGYGDITVCTLLGRAIMVVSIIIGITTTSILLIFFFMRLMEQDSSQEESHALLSILQRKKELSKAMVSRVETQVSYLSKKVPAEKRQEYQEKLNEFKFKNSRKIRYQKQATPNLKRMMMGNFAALLQGISQLKQTQIMLAKYVKIIQNSNSFKVVQDIESQNEL